MIAAAEMDFEAALAELDEIVASLEGGGPDLKAALASYGRGAELLGRCTAILDGAERSVALLTGVDDAGQAVTAPFDAAATAGLAPTPPSSIPAPNPTPAPAQPVPEAPF